MYEELKDKIASGIEFYPPIGDMTGRIFDKSSESNNITSLDDNTIVSDTPIKSVFKFNEYNRNYFIMPLVDAVKNNTTTETSNNNATIGQQINSNSNNTDSTIKSTGDFTETVKETRINYYDNLAFLRERMEQLNKTKPFYDYFNYLFREVTSKNGWW
jgi:hypothetical protein